MSEEVKDEKPDEVKPTETTDSGTTTVVGDEKPEEISDEELADMLAGKEDTDAILDAVKELTKIVGVLSTDLKQHMTAGKF